MTNRLHHTLIELPGSDYVVVRISGSGKVEALYERREGPLMLYRWDSGYVPSGHTLAKFDAEKGREYVEAVNAYLNGSDD